MDGYLTTQLLYVAAKLGIADVLAEQAQSAAELAPRVGADPDALWRVLRGLAAEGLLVEDEDGRFTLTDLGVCLGDGPGSLRGPITVRGELYFRAAAGLLPSVIDGTTPFEEVYGRAFFDHLDHTPADQTAFQHSMSGRAAQETAHLVAAYDWSTVQRLVDVGGGRGTVVEALLHANPGLTAVLFDQPAVVHQARQRDWAAGPASRCEFVGGDFFTSVPGGADVYLLSRVIHDWDDDNAIRVLVSCREAMTPDSRLLIADAVLPRRAQEQPAAIRMDLHMLLLLGARERTRPQVERLLAQAGLELRRLMPTASPDGLGIIEAQLAN